MTNSESLKYIKQSFDLKNRKLYKEAIEVLYKVLTDDVDEPTFIEVSSQIGDLHYILKNYDRAIEQYEHVLELDNNHEHSRNSLYDIYFELCEYNKALNIAQAACQNTGKAIDYVRFFTVLLKLKKIDTIFSEYEKLSSDLKEDSQIMYIVSLLKTEGRKEILEKVVEKSPNFTDAKFDLGLIYYEEENYEGAETLFNEILKIKKDPLSYYYKALIQIKRREFFPAIDNLHFAIKSCKGNIPEFYFELAKTYMDVNWFDEAVATIKNSITLYIKNGVEQTSIDKSYLLLAWVFEKQKDYDNALFNLSLIDKISPLYYEAEILNGLLAYRKGQIVNAKNMLETLYESKPQVRDDLTLIDTLGNIYRDLKLNQKAKEFFEKHLSNFPDSIHTACEYADLLIDMEDYEGAFAIMDKYSKYQNMPSFLNSKARIFYRKKEYEKTLSSLNELLNLDKNNAEGYYFKGLVLNTTKNYSEALKNIETALQLNPLPAKYYAQAACSYLELNRFDEALLYIKEAIEIEPNDLNYKKLAAEISKRAGKVTETAFWQSIVSGTEKFIKENKK